MRRVRVWAEIKWVQKQGEIKQENKNKRETELEKKLSKQKHP